MKLFFHGRRWRAVLRLSLGLVALAPCALPSVRSVHASDARDLNVAIWTPFTKADWLSGASILSLQQTSDAYTWIGTTEGLSIHAPDNRWLSLSEADGLAGRIITDITPDPSSPQRRWIAAFGGVTWFDDGGQPLDPAAHKAVTFTKADGLVEQYASAVAIGIDGRVWIGTANIDANGNELGYGLSVLDHKDTLADKADDVWLTFVAGANQLPSNVVRDIAVDGQGVVWVATPVGLSAYYSATWTTYRGTDGLPSDDVTGLTVSGSLLWVATKNGIAVLNDNQTPLVKTDDQWATYTPSNSGLVDGRTKSLVIDGVGRVWVGTNYLSNNGDTGYGFAVLDPAGTPFVRADDTWTTFTTADRLTSNAVRAVAVDAATATAWIGTRSGLSRLSFGTSVPVKSDDAWQTFTDLNSIAGYSANTSAHTGATDIWLGTEGGLSLLNYGLTPEDKRDDGYTTITAANGLPANSIRALAADPRGRLWIGTSAGLQIRDLRGTPANTADDLVVNYTVASGLPSDQINAIVIDLAGRGWVSTGSYLVGGVVVLDPGASLTSRFDDAQRTYTPANSSLPDTYVRAIALDGNQAWVATQNGAAKWTHNGTPFDPSDDAWQVFNTSNSGIAGNAVRDVKVDATHTAWFAHAAGGISAYTQAGAWTTFTQVDGLANNSVTCVFANADGSVWFGTDGGGVSVLNLAGTPTVKTDDTWTTYPAGPGLVSGFVVSIGRDRWGQMWIGTFGGGVTLVSDVQFKAVFLPFMRR